MEILSNKFLSNVQMFYSTSVDITNGEITIEGDESKHILSVMRYSYGDEICLTDGRGSIFSSKISKIEDKIITADILKVFQYDNNNRNLVFCLPVLKNPDRFEFALEKCIELGITEFIIYRGKNSPPKSFKKDRWDKISLAAMKQSLRSFLPEIKIVDSLKALSSLTGKKILMEQSAEKKFSPDNFSFNEHNYLIFGPEGGYSEEELTFFHPDSFFHLTKNRLRSETAIILAAGEISLAVG